MILFDAYALVAFLADEPAADEVEELLLRGPCAINVVNLAEAADISARIHGLPLVDVRRAVDVLVQTDQLLQLIPDDGVAWRAAELRNAHYRKRTCELSLGDCFLLASAGPGDEIATADPPVADVARGEAFAVVALPDSNGRRP